MCTNGLNKPFSFFFFSGNEHMCVYVTILKSYIIEQDADFFFNITCVKSKLFIELILLHWNLFLCVYINLLACENFINQFW